MARLPLKLAADPPTASDRLSPSAAPGDFRDRHRRTNLLYRARRRQGDSATGSASGRDGLQPGPAAPYCDPADSKWPDWMPSRQEMIGASPYLPRAGLAVGEGNPCGGRRAPLVFSAHGSPGNRTAPTPAGRRSATRYERAASPGVNADVIDLYCAFQVAPTVHHARQPRCGRKITPRVAPVTPLRAPRTLGLPPYRTGLLRMRSSVSRQ